MGRFGRRNPQPGRLPMIYDEAGTTGTTTTDVKKAES
jgi:hypothetical protein